MALSREQRRIQLEQLAGTEDGCGRLIGIYLFKIGNLPPIQSLVRRDWIPTILDAEFPEDDSPAPKTDDT